jgi:uncharacterized protein YggU (UPF0235/DUF167 family)
MCATLPHEALMSPARLPVRLTPGASAERIDGWEVDAEGRPVLKVRVRARPVEGEANAALMKLIAKALGVPKSAVVVQRGGQSRTKMLVIEGLSEDEAKRRLTGL